MLGTEHGCVGVGMTSEHRWDSVTVYGVSHSPWVQGVLIALKHRNIPHTLTSVPFGWRWVNRRGFIFPALRTTDGSIHLDSFDIYRLLDADGHHLGFPEDLQEAREQQVKLEQMFVCYALGRGGWGKNGLFFRDWSLMQEQPFRVWGAIWRAWLSVYFWALLLAGRLQQSRRGRQPFHLPTLRTHLTYWDTLCRERHWLSGAEMGYLDYALLGHIQCMASGLTPEILPLLREQEALLLWLQRALDTHPDVDPCFAMRVLDPTWKRPKGYRVERCLFWLAWCSTVVFLPFTVCFVWFGFSRRLVNPAHSGAVMRAAKGGKRPT